MKKNAQQIAKAGGQRASIRPAGNESPSHTIIDSHLHGRRLRFNDDRGVNTSHRF
jgi:hypothetical protein